MTMKWEIPTGAVDGFNTDFTLSTPYVTGTVRCAINGKFAAPAHPTDGLVELGGTLIRLRTAPFSGDTIEVVYDDGSVAEAALSLKVVLSIETIALPHQGVGKILPLVSGDRKPRLNFHFTDAQGHDLDLTGRIPRIRIRRTHDTIVLNVPDAMVVDNAVAGLAHYDFPATTLCTIGMLEAELSLDFGNGVIQTMPETLLFHVRRAF